MTQSLGDLSASFPEKGDARRTCLEYQPRLLGRTSTDVTMEPGGPAGVWVRAS
jgi:hypothetical protein